MPTFAIGVDLGGTNLRIAVLDESGKLLEKITTEAQIAKGRDHVVGEMCDAIRSLQIRFKSFGKLAGIGIGVPGIIDMESGMVRQSPNLPDWRDFPVRKAIESRLQMHVILENDANAAAFGEHWMGAGSEVDSLGMLTLGTGVGGGLILRGKIWHGMNGMAGELGHVTVDPDGPQCGCGNRGCLEQLASATAIKRMALEAINAGTAPELARAMREYPEFNARIVHQIAMQGDGPAQAIFRQVGRSLGIALAGLINIFNLPMFVIGGGVASSWEAFAPGMFEEIQKRSVVYAATVPSLDLASSKKKTIVTRALLGSDAGLFGAARLPMLCGEAGKPEREPTMA